ncbi:SHOCT domain-containing protein [Natronobacterium texcoconense]|uniref:Short C-terminal domain-containing protein n=1 Tax=Natronobacterium texcoconense TaxID=1095778 RepID=A0A1H1IMT1_NATTX|nr:hypothetical protein [Natronobacterium texcoconense]SDR38676.1 hypothetical protein SAMN04489842_3614 [Natronobacterium texcoconense]
MGRLGTLLLKGIGVFVLAFIVLSVIATIVGIAFSIVATIFSILVTVVVLGLFALAVLGLVSLLRSESSAGRTSDVDVPSSDRSRKDPQSRLRDQYVAGELSEAEFERELDRMLERDDTADRSGIDRSRDLDRTKR